MKRPVTWLALLGLLCGSLAFGQNKVPAGLVDVDSNYFASIDLSGSLYHSPTSRTFRTAQHAFDAIDDEFALVWTSLGISTSAWSYVAHGSTNSFADPQDVFDWIDANYGIVRTNWLFLDPTNLLFGVAGETTAKETFDWLDAWFASMGASNGFLKGTNIVGATSTNGQWLLPFTNIVLRPGTNWSFTVGPSNLNGYIDYVLYDPDPEGDDPLGATNLVLDVKLGPPASPMSAAVAAGYTSYADLAYWTLTNSVTSAWYGLAADKTNNICITLRTAGVFTATCDFRYHYGGYIEGVGARLYVNDGLEDTDEAESLSWDRSFHVESSEFTGASGNTVRVKFKSPDGGSLNYSTFKLYYLGPSPS